MRIRDAVATPGLGKQSKNSPTVKSGAGTSSLFAAELTNQQFDMTSYEQEVENLRQEIGMVGDKLADEPTLPNFKRFRDLLSQLAKRISNEAYRLEKIGGTPQNPRTFEIITVINAEADKLYNLIIKDNRDNMAITAKVIGIKGLVVDLIT
ncbi:YaaR family protein [Oryzomonas japonica]|uniref:YaaR family protein n=1 Tax=Oryzomonas japonica TaxID=2603858 RepID=A0A7J4ZPM4_9BACT|nr:YaaR family protein [Oryzomonas japonica]KAB0664657.1 YaaR family protein [Oryzomonas japonica]